MKRCLPAAVLALAAAALAVRAEEAPLSVVVHRSNPVTELKSKDVARLFLKKDRTWPDGRMAAPVDQSATSPLRAAFGKEILKLSMGEQRQYWMAQTLSGHELPPRALEDDAAVIEFVGKQAGGIAYVSASAALPESVKTVRVVTP